MKTSSEEIEQLAFDMWRVYQISHCEATDTLAWKRLDKVEKHTWINLAVFVIQKLEALADALTASKKTRKKKKKKPKK